MFIVNKILYYCNLLAILCLVLAYASVWVSPETIWWFSLFGLAFPYILLINLLFLVWWLFFRKFRMLYSGIALLIGWNHVTATVQWNGTGEALHADRPVYKIMSFNVRLFDLYNWEGNKETRNQIFKLIKEEDPDIICFQEFFYQDMPGGFATRDTMITFLKAKHVYEGYTHKLRMKQFFGLATFTASPVLNGGMITFPNDINNNVIYTDLKLGNDTIRVYNAHLASIRFQKADYEVWGDTEQPKAKGGKDIEQKILSRLKRAYQNRVLQTRILKEHMDHSPYPVILCGDFNDTPVSYTYAQLSSGLKDAFCVSGSGIGSTYSGKLPGLRIDYIFHDERIHSWNFTTRSEKLSDHFPIVTRFQPVGNSAE